MSQSKNETDKVNVDVKEAFSYSPDGMHVEHAVVGEQELSKETAEYGVKRGFIKSAKK